MGTAAAPLTGGRRADARAGGAPPHQPQQPPSAQQVAHAAGMRRVNFAAGVTRHTASTQEAHSAPPPPYPPPPPPPPPAAGVDDPLDGRVWQPRPSLDAILWPEGSLGRCVSEVLHGDGRRERCYVDGSRDVLFANGTRKVAPASPRGGGVVVAFANGDVKRTEAQHAEEQGEASAPASVTYYYAAVDTWHVTDGPTQVELFYFPSGQTEAHCSVTGRKDISFPDGSARRVYPDGREEELAR